MKRENEDELSVKEEEVEADENLQENLQNNGKHEETENSENQKAQPREIALINPPKRQRRGDDDQIRFLIPSKTAGAIIGKGGSNIQRIRTEFNVQINIADCKGPERIVMIASTQETCCKVTQEIMKYFDRPNVEEHELRLLIHQSLAGCVIGKAGAKITELKTRIGCGLKVFSNCCPQSTDRIVQIVGKEQQCMECLNEILNMFKTTPIKGQIRNYDPHNFDDLYADEYGGFGTGMNNSMRNNRKPRFTNDSRGDRYNNNDRGRQENIRRPVSNGSDNNYNRVMRNYVNPWAHNMNINGVAQIMNSDMSNFAMPNSADNNFLFGPNCQINDTPAVTSTQVSIPKDLAGAIIGKAGCKIRRIRQNSNASIKIEEPLPGSSERVITISGTQKQIEHAQYLLQQTVRDRVI